MARPYSEVLVAVALEIPSAQKNLVSLFLKEGKCIMFQHILLPLDGSRLAECTLPHACILAKAFNSKVTLLRVIEEAQTKVGVGLDSVEWYLKMEETTAYLEGLVQRFQDTGLAADYQILEGPAAQRVLEFVRREDVDLMLLSSHGKSGLCPYNISGVAQKIILGANVSTMIIRAYRSVQRALEGLRYRRLIVPLDGSKRAELFLPLAETLAKACGGELLLAHVVREPEATCRQFPSRRDQALIQELLERNRAAGSNYLKDVQSRLDRTARTQLAVSSDVALALHEMVDNEGVDLVLLSAHGRSAKPIWPFGSLTTNFIFFSGVALLIAQDFSHEELEPLAAELTTRESKGH